MKTKYVSNQAKNILLGIFASMMIFGFNSCARKATATSSTVVAEEPRIIPIIPEDKGQLEVKRDENSNYVIQINISDLEAVKSLVPAKEAYVVWMVAENKQPKNLGHIEGANTWLSKKEKASFEAVSALKPTKVFITAENDAAIQKPGSQIVWATNKF